MTEKFILAEDIVLQSIEFKSGQIDYKIDNNMLYIWSKDTESDYLNLDVIHHFHGYICYATTENGKILILVS